MNGTGNDTGTSSGGFFSSALATIGPAIGDYFSSRDIVKSQKRTESEQRALIRLQQEEQRLRNEILSAQLPDSNRTLPLSASNVSKRTPKSKVKDGTGTYGPDNPHAPPAEEKTAAVSGGQNALIGVAGLGVLLFFLAR